MESTDHALDALVTKLNAAPMVDVAFPGETKAAPIVYGPVTATVTEPTYNYAAELAERMAAQGNFKEWDEAAHPRDHGKFTSSGGGGGGEVDTSDRTGAGASANERGQGLVMRTLPTNEPIGSPAGAAHNQDAYQAATSTYHTMEHADDADAHAAAASAHAYANDSAVHSTSGNPAAEQAYHQAAAYAHEASGVAARANGLAAAEGIANNGAAQAHQAAANAAAAATQAGGHHAGEAAVHQAIANYHIDTANAASGRTGVAPTGPSLPTMAQPQTSYQGSAFPRSATTGGKGAG